LEWKKSRVFQLVYGDRELVLPLHFEGHVEDLLARLLSRDGRADDSDPRPSQLSALIVDAITAVVEQRDIPPTKNQLNYAIAIGRELNLELPAEILQDRQAMKQFLDRHAEAFRRRRPQQHRG
jgi:hypothetical protein